MNSHKQNLSESHFTSSEAMRIQLVLDLLTAKGPMERSDISRHTGWVHSTVSVLVNQMLKSKLLAEARSPARTGRGRPSSVIFVNPSAGAVIGIDLGFRHARGVIADISHNVLQRHEIELEQDYSIDSGFHAVEALINNLINLSGVSPHKIRGVGLAVPAPINREAGMISRSAMIPRWSGINIAGELEQRTGYRVFTDNESKLAAIAEQKWGAGQSHNSIIYLKLHSGVGGAVIANGQLVHGSRGGAGEFGHMSLDPLGPLCRCGNRGCLELYTSIPAILKAQRETDGRALTFQDVLHQYLRGDPVCERVIAESAIRSGQAIGMLCNALNPECVLIGGSLADAGAQFLKKIRYSAEALLLPMNREVHIEFGSLGKYASAMGAVALTLASAWAIR